MENSWQVKCGSALQSSAPFLASSSSQELRNQTERNAGYYSYSNDPHDLRLKVLGTLQDPLIPNYPDLSSQKSGQGNIGNSFLALLSGPPSVLQCDFKELSSSKLKSDSNSVVNSIGNVVPLRFSGSPSEYMSEQNLQPGANVCSSNSTRAVVGSNCCSNSVLPGLQSSDLEATAILRTFPSREKEKGSSSLNGEWQGAVSPNAGNLSSTQVQTSQMKSVEENSLVSNQSSNFLSDCPRAFCLGTGGYLHISSTGLLGIVCSCHCLRMSVLKFCEHSGLCGVNPGDAVRVDNGETIAQWRKLYFQKFGIRVPEDQSDWDWPEGLSATSGLVKSRSTLPNISHLAHSSGGFTTSGQLSDNVMLRNLHTNHNLAIDASQIRQKGDAQDGNNMLLKGLIDTFQSKMHPDPVVAGAWVMDSTTSKSVGCSPQDGCQSISAYTDFILKNGNLCVTHPSMQDLRTIGQKSDFTMLKNAPTSIFVGRDAAFSNIELKLGQPHQASQDSKISDRLALGPQRLGTVLNPSKLVFPEQTIHNNCRGKVELGQSLYFSTGSCSPSTKGEQNQMKFGKSGFELSNVNSAALLEKSRSNLAQNAVVSLANFNLLADNSVQIKPNNNILNCLEHTVAHTQHYEPRFAKCDLSNVLCNTGNSLERQLNMPEMSCHGLIDKGTGVKFVTDGSYLVKDSGSRIHKEFEISTSHPHFSSSQGSSCDLYPWPTVPLDATEARRLSNYPESIPSFGSSVNVDHANQRSVASPVGSGMILPSQVVTKGLPLVTSTCLSDQTPALHREESLGVSPHLLDDTLRMLALKQILELSKQQRAFSSFGMNKRDGRYDGVAYLHHSLAESLAPGEQCNGPGPISGREVSEATARAHLAGATSKFSGDKDMNGCCDLSTMLQGIPRHTKELAVQGQHSSEQTSTRREVNIAGPSEHGKCCRVPSVCSQHNCNCSAHVHCFKMNLESTVGSFPFSLEKQRGSDNGEASVIFGSKFAKNHIVPNDEIFSSDRGGKLNEKLPNNIVSHASQWRDVPSKVKRVSPVVCRDTSAEYINVTMQTKDSFKENETSNISSGSSAPAVTQLSVEVNKMDYSCTDAGNTGCISNLVVDEGSGIDKCWSSDDAHGSERSEEFLGGTCKTSCKESRSSKAANHKSSRSLLDELKLINSLTWKKGRKQIQTGTSLQDEDNLSNKGDRCSKSGERNGDCSSLIHDESNERTNSTEFPSAVSKELLSLSSQKRTFGACLNRPNSETRLSILSSTKKPTRKRDIYKIYDDKVRKDVCSTEVKAGASNCETLDISAGKRYEKDCTSNAFRQSIHNCNSRPTVCGKYGELSDGELVGHTSKPAKIVPLSRVLKLARRCTLPKNDKPAFTSIKGKKTLKNGDDGLSDGFHHLRGEKESRSHNVTVCGKINNETSSEKMKRRCSSRDNRFTEDLSTLETERIDRSENDHGKEDKSAHARLKSRSKEIRKRSIYELTVDGKGPHHETFSFSKISKCSPEVIEGTILRDGEDKKPGLCEVAEKSQEQTCSSLLDSDSFCCVCGSSNKDEINKLLECNGCLIKVHQGCYGVSRVPKGHWYCRPCRTSSRNTVCVLCGYGGGAMTRALRSRAIVKSLLRVWNVETECRALSVKALESSLSRLNSPGPECERGTSFPMCQPEKVKQSASAVCKMDMPYNLDVLQNSLRFGKLKVDNSVTAGFHDSTTKQWVHMVCGLWTPGTRCPNVDTMSAFDVSGAPRPRADMVCFICSRPGGSCIKCRVLNCSVRFHPWCAHRKGLLQSEVEGVDNESVGFYGRCTLHTTNPVCEFDSDPVDKEVGGSAVEELTCARTEGYKGCKRDGLWHNYSQSKGKVGCHVPQEQLNAWIHINGQKPCIQGVPKPPVSDIEHDCRKEYARYKQGRGWKHLVVYKSGIHALGLYTSRFISRGEMVVEYVGEIVGQRVADKRENEYQSGRKLQYKSACYFFRIDKEHIIDATRKGGIARFVNHSCLPNCVAKVISVRNEKKVVFFAERDIFPGEEITYDYHFNHEDEGKKIPCFCNSKNCRRYLN